MTIASDKDIPNYTDLIVVGAGPVGIKFVESFRKNNRVSSIKIINKEEHLPYDRVKLSNVLDGSSSLESIDLSQKVSLLENTYLLNGLSVEKIDPQSQSIQDNLGNIHNYGKLILATGSRAYVPHIDGRDFKRVYTMRNMRDVSALVARRVMSRDVVVVGGGLLGIETAKAMSKQNTNVTIVHQSPFLMNRQLDEDSAYLLQNEVESHGIKVSLGDGVRAIEGNDFARERPEVEAVILRSGEKITCDTVIFCTGIQPNLEMARNANIAVGQGIKINQNLETSEKNIFAIGECAEFDGRIYGLVAPGMDQAKVLANRLNNINASYLGSIDSSRLKVIGETVFSAGIVHEDETEKNLRTLKYSDKRNRVYRKLYLEKGRLVGTIGFGDWKEVTRIQEAIINSRKINVLAKLKFFFTGNLWSQDDNPMAWPSNTLVCNCMQVKCGDIKASIDAGCCSVAEIKESTGASTVCESCEPILAHFVQEDPVVHEEPTRKPLMVSTIIALLMTSFFFLVPEIPSPQSVLDKYQFQSLWLDNDYKQITGFSILGLTALGFLITLSKRTAFRKLLKFTYGRLFHVFMGLLCLFLLVVHTGFSMGENLNQWLMLNFVILAAMGVFASMIVTLENRMSFSVAKRFREYSGLMHLVAFWPLPVLLAFHIISVYYF